jgi:hypothetical protein
MAMFNHGCAKKARAFTIMELLVVIAIIVAMTTIGALAYGKIMRSTACKMGGQAIGNAFRLARQYSVNNRVPCMVELVDIKYGEYSNLGASSRVRVVPYKRIRDQKTGGLSYILSPTPIHDTALRESISFLVLPAPASVDVDSNGNDIKDDAPKMKIFFKLNPDGQCDEIDAVGLDKDGLVGGEKTQSNWKNFILFTDEDTPRGARERGLLYIAPTTGFIKERYYVVNTLP